MLKKMVLFAISIASRGLNDNKIDETTKKLRVLSCFGHGDIPPCKYLKKSSKSEYYYCGGCGCGDSESTWLIKKPGEYSKLDYPFLNCPAKLPGFSSYDPNSVVDKQRREKIENFDPENLKYIQVTVNRSEEMEHIVDQVKKIIENS